MPRQTNTLHPCGKVSNAIPIEVIENYFREPILKISPLGAGHINTTYQVESNARKLVVQRINTDVFRKPKEVMFNIQQTAEHLSHSHYDLQIMRPIETYTGELLVEHKSGNYRAFPLFDDVLVINRIDNASDAKKASQAFGKFSRNLLDFDLKKLHFTIPGFHDFSARLIQLDDAAASADSDRLYKAQEELKKTRDRSYIVDKISKYQIPNRVLHSDPKINNILFDQTGSPLCIIDLDTIMPGPLFYDFSDMVRSYTNTADEDEADLLKVTASEEVLKAVIQGYLGEVNKALTEVEWQSMIDGFALATYIQVVRFLTDYLNNDIYYSVKDSEHNLTRTRNQLKLLEDLLMMEEMVVHEITKTKGAIT